MAIIYVTQRPAVTPTVRWDGNNLAEIEAFITEGTSIVDNGDGTLTFDDNMMQSVVHVGDHLTPSGYLGPLNGGYQQLAGNGPVEYVVTDVE